MHNQFNILDASISIEAELSNFLEKPTVLMNICKNLLSNFKLDFAAINLVNPEKNVIEMVASVGEINSIEPLSIHPIEPIDILPDINVDIVLSHNTEIILGWDNRFDHRLHKQFNKNDIVRIFSPIIIAFNSNGELITDWFENCDWKFSSYNESFLRRKIISNNFSKIIPNPKNFNFLTLGTLEAGSYNINQNFDFEKGVSFAKYVLNSSLNIYSSSIENVLRVIAEKAIHIIGADSATIHFPYDTHKKRYVYEISSGYISTSFLKHHPPRSKGLGSQCIKENKPKIVPDERRSHNFDALRSINPGLYSIGIQSVAAFPLIPFSKDLSQSGVLYIHFRNVHWFTTEEINLLKIFSNRALDALRYAFLISKLREEQRKLLLINTATRFLTRIPTQPELLPNIAFNTLKVLAADITVIYEFIESENILIVPPVIEGKIINKSSHVAQRENINGLLEFIKNDRNIFCQNIHEDPFFNSVIDFEYNDSFIIKEKIFSGSGIILKVDNEIVGIMLIYFRRPFYFNDEDRSLLLTFASYAAIAIKNNRLLTFLSNVDNEILSTLDYNKLFSLIVKYAVQLSKADIAEIRLLDFSKSSLKIKAIYPDNIASSETKKIVHSKEGISGLVLETGFSQLFNDCINDARHIQCYAGIQSEICVPIFDKYKNIIGVLNAQSYMKNAFGLLEKKVFRGSCHPT